ncbi:MAG: acyl--CoA ligase [Desulfobacterales bacterium]|nr:acyl--CoA ligase [Desulfobacterales bacterium]
MEGGSLKDCFTDSALKRGEKTAIRFLRGGGVETEISYSELNRDSNRLANYFQDLGVEKGDRVVLFFPKTLIFAAAHLALQKIGALSVPLNPGFKQSEMAYLVNDADAKLVLSDASREGIIKKIDPGINIVKIDADAPYQELEFFRSFPDVAPKADLAPDDPGVIIYTSGTTGKPKGAVLTQMNLVHDAKNIIDIWEITKSDTLCHALPLFHVHGLCFALHTALLAGSRMLMLDLFSPDKVVETLANKEENQRCSLFMAVPAMYAKLMAHLGDERPDFSHMRLWTSGSAPLLVSDFKKIKEIFGKEPVEREGMSETGMNFSNPVRGARKPGSIGPPLPGLDVRIVDPVSYKDATPGEEGEIWLKSAAITPGYWRKPKETAETFEQGWFKTGDLGRVDEDGYYYLTDRIKHIIISGGENISPKEIEIVINRMDGVVESSVVGVPDEKWGEKVVAAVVKEQGAAVTADDVKRVCKEHLHGWKCPKEIVFPEKLPRNTMGKVLKEDVKEFF